MRGNPIVISDELLVSLYLETNSLLKTARIAQNNPNLKCAHVVAKKLRNLGVEVKNHKLKPIQVSDEELIQMYNSGLSLVKIALKVLNSKGGMTIRKKLLSLGVDTTFAKNVDKYKHEMSIAFHKYTLNEHVFDSINTEEKAYWLGFLMADGYNHQSKSAICLRLLAEDDEILERFKLFLLSNAPIYSFCRTSRVSCITREYRELRVNSVYLSEQLAKLGCVLGKTYTLEYPTYITEDLMPHFIRGYFDGDGCISIRKRNDRKSLSSMSYQFTIAGRKEFLEVLLNYLVLNVHVTKNSLKIHKNNFALTIHYSGFNVVLKLLNYLYKDATIYLKRKHDKYMYMVTRLSNLQKLKNSVNSENILLNNVKDNSEPSLINKEGATTIPNGSTLK